MKFYTTSYHFLLVATTFTLSDEVYCIASVSATKRFLIALFHPKKQDSYALTAPPPPQTTKLVLLQSITKVNNLLLRQHRKPMGPQRRNFEPMRIGLTVCKKKKKLMKIFQLGVVLLIKRPWPIAFLITKILKENFFLQFCNSAFLQFCKLQLPIYMWAYRLHLITNYLQQSGTIPVLRFTKSL